jgi:sugar-specific transcriptional regulator TrmB
MRNAVERQNALFYECIEDAIADDIKALGGPKKVAEIFFRDKTVDQGAAYLRAWSNAERSERPSPSQYILLKKLAYQVGSRACWIYEEQELSVKVAHVEPEDELQRIERENNELLKALTKRLDRADSLRSQLKAVK